MNKPQLFLVLSAIILVLIIYQLPRIVVENDQLQEVATVETHRFEIPSDVNNRMVELKRLIEDEENVDKKTNFAYSLARYYLDYGILDSAVAVGKRMESWNDEGAEVVSDIYFKAYERAQDQEAAKNYASEARTRLIKLLDKDPSNLFLKNKLAMTLVVTENPMSGISMLREVLRTDEDFRPSILNLGLLAIQSGQFVRAKERFGKLISLDATDHEAKLYLAVSMMEINEQLQARLLLEEIIGSNDSIPAIKMMAMDYLNEL